MDVSKNENTDQRALSMTPNVEVRGAAPNEQEHDK